MEGKALTPQEVNLIVDKVSKGYYQSHVAKNLLTIGAFLPTSDPKRDTGYPDRYLQSYMTIKDRLEALGFAFDYIPESKKWVLSK